MIQYGNRILPECGKILKTNNEISFSVPVETECEELEIDTNNILIVGSIAMVDNKFAVILNDERQLKARLINKMFSNDDQMGIMLNYQYHKTAENTKIYKLMQDWRDWFSVLIKQIKEYGTQDN
jgi:hypothetical protein